MGDGGVACATSQHVMERFPVSEAYCGGGGGLLASKVFKPEKQMNTATNGKQLERKGEVGVEKGRKSEERTRRVELEKGELVPERRRRGETEKGEQQNGELDKREFSERWRRGEVEAGEFIPERGVRGEVEKGEFISDKSRKGRGSDKSDTASGRRGKVELEKGEFVPERCRKDGCERVRVRSPDDGYWRKGGGLSERDHRKRPLKSDGGAHERDSKKYSRAAEEELSQYKSEINNGKSHNKDHHVEDWPKRNFTESDGSSHKCHSESTDLSGSKVRRLHRDASSRVSSASRYSSSRHHESSLPSRGGHDRHGRSPGYLERSPRERARHHDHRDRSPSYSERSPLDRARPLERRDRTPSRSDRSPHERVRHADHRDRTPGRPERSQHDRGRTIDHRELHKKNAGSERQQNSRHEERLSRRECSGKESKDSFKENSAKQSNSSSSRDRSANDKSDKKQSLDNSTKEFNESPLPPPPPPPLPPPPFPPQPESNGVLEELASMEEDMDICDTPPHDIVTADSREGKWFYIDQFGIEQGPSRLADLKKLVDEGRLLSDHLIKHYDTDRWVTVENAASPLVPMDLPSIFSDVVTQMVSPPEAPGNLLADAGDFTQETSIPKMQQVFHVENGSTAPEFIEDLRIDERVVALLDGHTVINGKELETLGEALHANFEYVDWENWGHSEGFTRSRARMYEPSGHPRDEGAGRTFEGLSREAMENRLSAPCEKEYPIHNVGFSDWFAGRWSCKGGDWKRNEEAGQDRYYKKKLILNEGYPLCQMPKCGNEDPRWFSRDDLYYPSRIKKLDLPPWGFSSMEDKSDSGNDTNKNMLAARAGQIKLPLPRGVKGTMLPVVRINACVVKDHGTFEPRVKVKGSERHTPRSSRPYSTSSDRVSFSEGSYSLKKTHEHDLQSSHMCRAVLNIPRDHVCTIDELSVDLGDWYYLDGAGHERGPSSYSELQELAVKGTITEHSSIFRKIDNVWLPIATNSAAFEAVNTQDAMVPPTNSSSSSSSPVAAAALSQSQVVHNEAGNASNSFHSVHPQFIGYMRGKLHELVMKSYKNREFAASINEVLDPWLSARQPKKEVDKHFPFNSSITKSSVLAHELSGDKFWKSGDSMCGFYEDNTRSVKRARLLFDRSDEESETEEELLDGLKNDRSFEDLCGEAASVEKDSTPLAETDNWGLLNGRILARIFHFLRTDMKSLVSSAITCKRWNTAVRFYKNLCKHVDLSYAGPNCTDSMFLSIMGGYDKKNVTSLVLTGCSNVSARVLEEALQLFPCLSSIDIRGCCQFKDLESKYLNIKWIKSLSSRNTKNLEESYTKIRSLKKLTDKSPASKTLRGLGSCLDDSGEMLDFGGHEVSLLDRKDSSNHPFRQGFYKRTKLLDSRKSSAIPSRNARMRQWLPKKSQNNYRKMEEFIALSLKDIMKGNRFEFFIPKVAKIEDRMKSGYYVRYGLNSVKDDISRMCRDALKAKNRVDAGDLKQIIMSFIQLAESLKENQLSRESDEMIKTLKDGSDAGFFSSAAKYTKKQNKVMSGKKGMHRTQSTSYANGGTDYGSYAFDHEIKRSLSKLKKKYRGSESETSDDHDDDLSEEDVRVEAESTASDTESDLDLQLGDGTGDIKAVGYSMTDDTLDSTTEDREWGARMTKVSLVPPITRKYEVIDRYLVIADEEEVQRKMRVALPDDYTEKLIAQKSGVDESDMELPEVKEYKPRKMLGVEVLEQEVYGIDPYTHNLLLDTMPKEPEWPLVEKHKFIEEVLLCLLNKQVRHFTGAGNTPMVYPLHPVVEEIRKNAEEGGDARVLKMCQAISMSMQTRTDDNYVAYRKGLGVVCNKEEGFGQEDFVVEFLGEVYPAWKWFEKQDGIRSLQKNNQDPAPEFYNIYLERPKGDHDGYDLVVVDAMHKANYASRICHSCRPNCEAKVTAVDGQYQIGIYTVRPIGYGEEITFDYNSVTESKEEYEASVCLCGSHVCRGSYLNLTGEGAFQKILRDCHGVLDRHKLMLEACESSSVSQEDYVDLARAGLGTCLLAGLPDWLVAYSAHLVRYINLERTMLPDEILKHNLEEKRKFFSDVFVEVEKNEAEVQAEGVYNARLQNMALTLDKVRYVMRRVFGDPKNAPPPLQKLGPEALVSVLWEGEGSLVEELLQSMAPHVDSDLLNNLVTKIHAHNPSRSDDLQKELRKSLLWLRDELRNLPCTYKCRHDAAADLIHIYAHTKCFFKVREYKTVKSPPVYISPLDLGPKYADKMGSGFQEYCKAYGENYCLGQLIYWYSQTNIDPDSSLAKARRGCLSLPDISSFYAKSHKPLREHVYGSRTLRFMLSRMEKEPQRPWPKDRIWLFRSSPRFFGSPMLDAVLNKCPLDREMMHWLKSRPSVFQGSWDG